ncbi:MAG TPA: response regulator [Caulobacteraceae bacterium]|nr:response regulator [Caulobacteraceae bacterium]
MRNHQVLDERSSPASPTIAAPEPLRILAAEDNLTNQLVLRVLLDQAGLAVTMVEDGRAAVEHWEAAAWDLILMDVQMPVMDGLSATTAIRAREVATGRRRTPIVAVTANVMSHEVEGYFASGMDGLVAKPITVATLFAAIGAALEGPSVSTESVA